MALPYNSEKTNDMFSEIIPLDINKIRKHTKKEKLVSQYRLSAGFEVGGLQIQHPKEVITGMQLNLI